MSGQAPNDRANLEPIGEQLIFRTAYMEAESRWMIEAMGEPDIVRKFAAERPFELYATPISEEEAEKRRAEVSEKASGQRDKPPLEEQPARPSLELRFYLLEFAQPNSPHLVHFAIDPNPPFSSWFYLQGEDITADVSFSTNQGQVSLSLFSWVAWRGAWDGPAVSGNAVLDKLPKNSGVGINVYGDPRSSFTTSGDFVS
jgi:hypothetical protein